jgi:thiamine-monophosphate kinase
VPQTPLTVAELSEAELLTRIFPRLELAAAHNAAVLLGPGDDAAIVAVPDGRTVVSIDTQVQDQDFRLQWKNGYRTTGYDVGWKAAAQNLSDINAMGAVATSMVVSLTMPSGTPVDWVEDLADGLAAAIGKLGAGSCSVAGGDLGRGGELSVTVAVLGTLTGGQPVLRSGAAAGDILAIAGNAGQAAAGLALLESGHALESLTPDLRLLLDLQCRPEPPLEAGPLARLSGATAMMDISDGLVRDGTRLANASGVVLNLDAPALRLLAAPLQSAAALLGADPLAWVLGGGEDHGLLTTFPAGVQLPPGFAGIGSVQARGTTDAAGVTIAGRPADSVGWDHFAD